MIMTSDMRRYEKSKEKAKGKVRKINGGVARLVVRWGEHECKVPKHRRTIFRSLR